MHSEKTLPKHCLEQLLLFQLRNVAQLSLLPGPRFNVIYGDNGHGKTTILEAIHYLTSMKSFRSAKNENLIQRGQQQAAIAGRFTGNAMHDECKVKLSISQPRRFEVNAKRPRSKSSHFQQFQSVVFHAEHLRLISGSPELRRSLLDDVLERVDDGYADTLATYQKALRQRNRLLKSEAPAKQAIAVYDQILVQEGIKIIRSRQSFTAQFSEQVCRSFYEIFGQSVVLDLSYRPRVPASVDTFFLKLSESFLKDSARGFTAEGPHADDLQIEINNSLAKHEASQGQQRSIALAMKVAELFFIAERSGKMPIFLLDDVSSELDRERNRRLFEYLHRVGGQVFLTTTHREFILLDAERKDFHIRDGKIV